MDVHGVKSLYRLCIVATFLFAAASGFQSEQQEWTEEPPALETRNDVDRYLNVMEQKLRLDMNRAFTKEFAKRSADAGLVQPQILGLGEPVVHEGVNVSAVSFFMLNGRNYTVVAERTLNDSYIGLVSRAENGSLLIQSQARFSVGSFVDSQYRATYQHSLRRRVIRLKAHVFSGRVFMLTELEGGTLLFFVSDPGRSWLPRYQDSVLSQGELASDFAFFEQPGRLCVAVAVGRRRAGGALVPATVSYIYQLKAGVKWLQTHTLPTEGAATSVTTFGQHRWTYIVVGQNTARSMLYRLHWDTGALELFQYLPSGRVVAVEAFTHHAQTYVLLAKRGGSATIFWWTSDQLFEWQSLSPDGAEDGQPVLFGRVGRFSSGESFIYLVRGTRISFYTTFSSQAVHFALALTHDLPPTSAIRHVQATRVGRGDYYLLVSVQEIDSVKWVQIPMTVNETSIDHRSAVSPPSDSGEPVPCLDEVELLLDTLDRQLDALLRLADAVLVRNGTQNVTGRVSVAGRITVSGTADVHQLQIVSHGPSNETEHAKLDDVKDQIERCNASLSSLNEGLRTALTASGEQMIAGNYTFSNLLVQGNFSINDASRIENLNRFSYQRLLLSPLTFTGDQTLSSPLSIGSASVTSLVLTNSSTINGQVASELMYVSGPQTVTGVHRYRRAGVSGHLALRGTLNGVRLAAAPLLGQTLTVPEVKLSVIRADRLSVTNVNQRNLSAWRRDVISLDLPHTFPGRLVGGAAAFSDLRVDLLSGRRLDDFLRALWKTPNSRVEGVTRLLGPVSVQHLTSGRVNGVHLASDLLTTYTDQTVTSHLRLARLQVTRDLETGRVNGLDLSRRAVRTTGRPGAVQGSVIWVGDLAVTGDVTTADDVTLNGADLSAVSELASPVRRALHFGRGVALVGDWRVTGAVSVRSVHGYPLDQLRHLFWTTDGDQDISVPVTISESLTIKHNLTVHTVNGARTDTFINTRRGGTLLRDAIFLGDLAVSEVTLLPGGLLNGRHLARFAPTVVTRGGDQVVSGVKAFSGAVRVGSLAVRRLNRLKLPQEVVLVDQEAVQTGSLTFLTDIEVLNNVSSSGEVDVLGAINGHRVRGILPNLTNVWVNHTTNHVLTIQGNVHFHDIHVVEELNGGGVLELLEGLLYRDRDALVPGTFTVHGDVTFGPQLGLHTVNGLSWTDYLSSVILSDAGGAVAGSTTLTSSLTADPTATLRLDSLNGLTLPRLYSQFLTRQTRQLVRIPVTVQGTVTADILNVNRVNSVPVNQLMFTDRELHFYKGVHFFSDLTAHELRVATGVVGDCNLTRLWEAGLRKSNASQVLELPTTIGSLTVNGSVTLSQDDVTRELLAAFDRLVTNTGNHTITGKVTFDRPLSVTQAEVASYNGHSLNGLCEDALTTADSQTAISHPVTLLGPVTFGSDVTVTGDVTVGLLNGGRPERWLGSLVLRGDQEVTLTGPLRVQQDAAAGHVVASGSINGQPQSAWVERDSDIAVDRLYFDRGLTIIDGLSVTGLVAGVNVSQVLETTVSLVSEGTIAGDIVINGDVTAWMHLNAEMVNGLRLSEDPLVNFRLDRLQTVTGAKHFETLVVDGGLCGVLNGVRPAQLCGQLLSADSTAVQLVTRPLAFKHPPANLEEPTGRMADNLTSVTALLRQRGADASRRTERLRAAIGRVGAEAASLLQTPDYSVDLAYLLEVQRLAVPRAASVRSPDRDLRLLDVLLRSEVNCTLPAGCLCRYTDTLQIGEDGLLRSTGSVQPGQRWTFHVRELQQVFTVTALTDGYSRRCQSAGPVRVSVTRRPAGGRSGTVRRLPLATAPAGHISDVQIFSFRGRIYMVLACGSATGGPGVAVHPDTELLALEGLRWRRVQRLPSRGAVGLDLSLVHGVPHLLVVNRLSRESLSLQGEVQLWIWDENLQKFSELRAFYHADIQAAAFLHAHDKAFVIVADLDGLTVLEYSTDLGQYSVCQYLAEPGVSALTSFVVGAESFLAVFSSKLNELVVYLVTHQEGLRRHCAYPAAAVRSLAAFSSGRRLLLAAVHPGGLVVYRVVVRGRMSLVTTSAARLPPNGR